MEIHIDSVIKKWVTNSKVKTPLYTQPRFCVWPYIEDPEISLFRNDMIELS